MNMRRSDPDCMLAFERVQIVCSAKSSGILIQRQRKRKDKQLKIIK